LTHNSKYRDAAWQLALAIHRHCRMDSVGFSSIASVEQVSTLKTNYQPPHLLGATLKYLYLIFADEDVLPIDKWVFNRAGQPFPVCGQQCDKLN